jgi:hypothetical protein
MIAATASQAACHVLDSAVDIARYGTVRNSVPGTKHQFITWCFKQITVLLKMVCCVAVIQEPSRPQKCVSSMGVFCNFF